MSNVFCDSRYEVILSCHDNIITSSFPTKEIHHYKFSCQFKDFMFAMYIEHQKVKYQTMLTLQKMIDYVANNPDRRVHHFLKL